MRNQTLVVLLGTSSNSFLDHTMWSFQRDSFSLSFSLAFIEIQHLYLVLIPTYDLLNRVFEK